MLSPPPPAPGLLVPAGVAEPDVYTWPWPPSGSSGLMMMEVCGLWLSLGEAGWIASSEAEGSGTPRLEADSCRDSTCRPEPDSCRGRPEDRRGGPETGSS